MLSRPDGEAQWHTPGAAAAFGLVVAVALAAALFPWHPGGAKLREGEPSPFALSAPTGVSYESDVLTERARAAAAAAVPSKLVREESILRRQLGELGQQLAGVRDARAATLSDSERESRIRAAAAGALAQSSIVTLAAVSGERFDVIAAEAGRVLRETLGGGVTEEQAAAARASVPERLLAGSRLTAAEGTAAAELVAPLVVPNVVADAGLTEADREAARARVAPVRVTRERGQLLVEEGQELTAADLELLRRAELGTGGVTAQGALAAALVAALAGAACGAYLFVVRPRALSGARRLALFALLLTAPAAALQYGLPLVMPDLDRQFLAYALPLAAAPMAAAVLLELGAALLLAMLLSVLAGFVAASVPFADAGGAGQIESARMALTVGAGSLAGVFVTARATNLNRYLAAGFAVGGAAVAALLATWLLDAGRQAGDLAWIAGAGGLGGLASALIGVGFFVVLSRPFGIITRVALMELAQLSHPLLRRLQDEAPGTFQHSVMVSTMAERAADRIGADSLLVRVGAYYHDIGKLTAPEFFVENSPAGEDPHATLDPLQSTRLIQQHVLAGAELARREGVPAAVAQFIPQHHGTRRVQFFYRRAAAADPDVDPELFRYPGPRPQSREAAILMLADSSEAAVRASADRSRERIAAVVEEIVRERVDEDQFDECDISLRDLRIVADSFVQTLNAVYHPRVEYPEPTAHEIAERGGAPPPRRAARPAPPAAARAAEAPPERGGGED